ncbi:PIN domain-containing protein, partial [Geoglobus sp.]
GEGYRLSIKQGDVDFERQRSHFDHLAEEVPSYSDFVECLLASGVITYENMERFRDMLSSYRSLRKRVYFCPDTNVIYHRFLTASSLVKHGEVMLVETTREEIESSLNFKYTQPTISELKRLAKYQPFLLDEFINRRMKKSRLAAYIAMKEYRELRKHAIEIEGVEQSTDDREANDFTIVRTLRRFEKERAAMPVLLTADRQMADICEAESIEYFHFTIPHAVDAEFCSCRSLIDLIYSLASVFGVIRLNSVVIFGEFRGKKSHDELKLRFLDDQLYQDFSRHFRICRRLMGLGIEN